MYDFILKESNKNDSFFKKISFLLYRCASAVDVLDFHIVAVSRVAKCAIPVRLRHQNTASSAVDVLDFQIVAVKIDQPQAAHKETRKKKVSKKEIKKKSLPYGKPKNKKQKSKVKNQKNKKQLLFFF